MPARTITPASSIPDTGGRQLFVADLTLRYNVSDATNVFATARNVFDEEYVVGRLPQGARPGMPQLLLFGVESQFCCSVPQVTAFRHGRLPLLTSTGRPEGRPFF